MVTNDSILCFVFVFFVIIYSFGVCGGFVLLNFYNLSKL